MNGQTNVRGKRGGPVRRAFTIIELMVVAAIFVLLIALAVPAFSNMLYSSEQSMAENAMRVSLSAARDAAARSPRGEDAAAVFFFEPGVGYTIVPYIYAGVVADAATGPLTPGAPNTIQREIFVPVPGFEPVQLPRNWMIRGFAPPNSIDGQWYGNVALSPQNPYDITAVRQRGNWVFPETGFYNPIANQGTNRQTFMMRFEGGTGILKQADPGNAVLILSPSPYSTARPPFALPTFDPLRETDGHRLVRRVLAAGTLNVQQKQQLLGDRATDTVLAKSVTTLALYNERALASAVGAQISRETGCIYQFLDRPVFLPQGAGGLQFVTTINEWIQAHPNRQAESDARIFTVHRYLGTVQEVSGSYWPGALP